MEIPNRNAEIKGFLTSVLNQLEKDKKSIQLGDEDAMELEGFALAVFQKADKIDRAGRADKNTAKIFYAASLFFEILRQFGDLNPEIESKQKYAAWKAADIRRAIDKGLTPRPGPPIKDGDEEAEDDEAEVSGATVSSSTVAHASLPAVSAVERPPTPLPETMTTGLAPPLTPQPPLASTGGAASGEYYGGGQHQPLPPAAAAQYVRSSSFAFSPPENPCFGMPPSAPLHPPPTQPPSSYSSYPSTEGAAAPTVPFAVAERPSAPSYNAARAPYTTSSQPSAPTVGGPTQGGYPGVAGVAAHRSTSHGTEAGSHVQGWAAQAVPGTGARTVGASAGPGGPGHASNGPFAAVHHTPSPDKVAEAHKAARFAVSALAFDDVPTAITYLQRSLQLLTNPSAPI
ncbi:hypothetical protein CBR_g50394 [Chara braunii]|uniref:Vta1/callose synthase N-terminal domain-containing protein n=1 Tax=Chara braunii TaxID=69332 RepID=A0A388M6T5_CHABU|nr:hypothetical protein CBR_g50394 [Chara braunii]|eukprot:GBG90215.1 hypothetical protein CBR_g50394 [Chara braunii]